MSCDPGGLLTTRDAVAKALAAAADPAARVTVHTDYAPDWLDVDLWKDNPDLARAYNGRHLYVFPGGKAQAATASRRLDLNEYRIEVVALERYDGDRAVPPDEWTAERLNWVETEVYDVLGDARAEPEVVENCFPQAADWQTPYSPDLLRELKLFRSGLVFTFRRLD